MCYDIGDPFEGIPKGFTQSFKEAAGKAIRQISSPWLNT
jgi:hypothetical protein